LAFVAHFAVSCYFYFGIQKLLGEYLKWLQSNSANGGKLYKEQFEKRWTSITYPTSQIHLETHDLAKKVDLSIRVIENLSAGATSKLFEKQIREAVSSNFLWPSAKFS
jgi:hypothetical protein